MAIYTSSPITFLDLTDQQQLSAYLTSNLSTIQILSLDGETFSPSWSDTPLVIKAHAFLNQLEIDYSDKEYKFSWAVKDGNLPEVELVGEENSELTINTNTLKNSTSGMLTYICRISYNDVNFVDAQITYTLISESKSVVFSIYAPEGTIFLNQSGTLKLMTEKYYGPSPIVEGATYKWYRYSSSGWGEPIEGATTDSLEVVGEDVINIASYKCVMTFMGVEYTDVITLEDKTDIYTSEMFTIGGNIFKNGIGGSAVYMIVRVNGVEKDPLSGALSVSKPPSPKNGDYWYQIDNAGDSIILNQYTNSSWHTINKIPQQLTYVWTLMDREGNKVDFHDGSATKKGKVIYISCADINETCTLHCEVLEE